MSVLRALHAQTGRERPGRRARDIALRLVPGLAVAWLLLGCATWKIHLAPVSGDVTCGCRSARPSDVVEIRYLGSGGFLIQRGGTALLTAPFFSNPGLLRVILGLPIQSDPDRVERGLRAIEDSLTEVEAILVGHAHYDHLMDVPAVSLGIARRRGSEDGRKPTIYGSRTMAHILAAFQNLAADVKALNSEAGTWRRPGRWQPEDSARPPFRFMALHSEHSPHFLGVKAFGGKLREGRSTPPWNAYGWREGQTFAFVIDLLGPDDVYDFRIHYQDTASSPPYGFPPPFGGDDALPYDVAILCVAAFARVRDYPEGILRELRPRHVILGHWESFFRGQDRSFKPVTRTDTRDFVARLESALSDGAQWTTPEPGASVRFCLGPEGGWRLDRVSRKPRCEGASGPRWRLR